jgi:hypothetical protein
MSAMKGVGSTLHSYILYTLKSKIKVSKTRANANVSSKQDMAYGESS